MKPVLALLLVVPLALTAVAAPRITARLEPEDVAVGEPSQLSVTLEGEGTLSEPEVPTVDGLRIQRGGRSTNMQVVNGHVTSSISLLFQVTALRAGVFTIPPIAFTTAGGEKIATSPVSLRVAQTPGQTSAPSGGGSDRSKAAVLDLVYPRRAFFVGELVPVQVQLRVRAGVQVSEVSPPTLTGNAFTVSGQFDHQPVQSSSVVDGVTWTVLTWPAAVAAVKPGPQELHGEIEAVMALPAERGTRRRDPFDDPFFEGFFDRFLGGVRRQRVQVSSTPATVEVLPLPEAGRPDDFAGAIGSFQLSVAAAPTRVAAGDPITLSITVDGHGNFDRVATSGLPTGNGWKSYSPGATFKPADTIGYSGSKRFEQAIIAQGGEAAIPPIRFSFFDPETRRYQTLSSAPIPIDVTGTIAPPPPLAARTDSGTESRPALDLVPNAVDIGRLRPTLVPLLARPRFLAALPLPPLVLLAGWLWDRRRRRLAGDPGHLRAVAAGRAVRANLRAMDAAVAREDPAALFSAARRAVQASLGRRWALNPEAITLSEVDGRLDGGGDLAESVRRIFQAADAATYSGQTIDAATLGEWRRRVVDTLAQLERSA